MLIEPVTFYQCMLNVLIVLCGDSIEKHAIHWQNIPQILQFFYVITAQQQLHRHVSWWYDPFNLLPNSNAYSFSCRISYNQWDCTACRLIIERLEFATTTIRNIIACVSSWCASTNSTLSKLAYLRQIKWCRRRRGLKPRYRAFSSSLAPRLLAKSFLRTRTFRLRDFFDLQITTTQPELNKPTRKSINIPWELRWPPRKLRRPPTPSTRASRLWWSLESELPFPPHRKRATC